MAELYVCYKATANINKNVTNTRLCKKYNGKFTIMSGTH